MFSSTELHVVFNIIVWVDVSWPQNATANNDSNYNVKVVDISDPDVQGSMLEVEKRGKNENNKKVQSALDNTLKQVVLSFGKRSSTNETNNSSNKNMDSHDHNEEDKPSDPRIDLANLQFLMAVEDLLDSSSSDLVANALAEANSLRVDQLRLATQSFRNTLQASSKSRPTPSAQGSRESQSPPTEINVQVTQDSNSSESPKTSTDSTQITTVEENSSNQEKLEKEVAEKNTKKEGYGEFKEECMSQIQKISSSMSEVLDSITLKSSEGESNTVGNGQHNDEHNEQGDLEQDDYCEIPNENALSVAENNFLNDNHSALETNVISIFNDEEDDNDDDDEEDDDDDFSDQDFVEIGAEDEAKYELIPCKQPDQIEHPLSDDPTTAVSSQEKKVAQEVSAGNITLSANDVISQDALASMLQALTGSNESVENIDDITQQALRLLSGGKEDFSKEKKKYEETKTEAQPKVTDVTNESISIETDKNSNVETTEALKTEVSTLQVGIVSKKNTQAAPKDVKENTTLQEGVKSSQVEGDAVDGDDDDQMYTLEEILQMQQKSTSTKKDESTVSNKTVKETSTTKQSRYHLCFLKKKKQPYFLKYIFCL